VVVDEPGGLHERVAGRGADEAEAAPFQLLAHRRRLGGLRRDLRDAAPAVHLRLAVDERPEQLRERSVERKRRARIADDSLDLAAVADDACIAEQPLDIGLAEPRDPLGTPVREGASIALALAQDRRPRQACLGAFEIEQLEEGTVVSLRNAPLLVVVGDVERIAERDSGTAGGHSANR